MARIDPEVRKRVQRRITSEKRERDRIEEAIARIQAELPAS